MFCFLRNGSQVEVAHQETLSLYTGTVLSVAVAVFPPSHSLTHSLV